MYSVTGAGGRRAGRLLGGRAQRGTHSDISAHVAYLEYQKPYLIQGDERLQEQEHCGRNDSEHGAIDHSSRHPLNF